MITLKRLKWDNVFSYGKSNVLDLDEHQIVQLIGKNGHGKSSIPLIIEEVLYNKNSKSIKKGDILNRNISDKSYTIELSFEKDGDLYTIETKRGSSQTVKLTQNSTDISAHTATNTYKLIEEIVGFDAKTFSQLIYQSSMSSLEFLTATDTNRKKFLIDLLNLTKYTEAFEIFKLLAKQVSEEVSTIETKISTTQSWLDKNAKENLELLPIVAEPSNAIQEIEQVSILSAQLKSIESTNKKIIQNNQYKKLLGEIPIAEITRKLEPVETTTKYVMQQAQHQQEVKSARAFIKKLEDLGDSCPTCLQGIDKSKNEQLVDIEKAKIVSAEALIADLDITIKKLETAKKEFDKVTKYKSDWESYSSLIDSELEEDLLDKDTLKNSILQLENSISEINTRIKTIQAANTKASGHNARVNLILEQIDGMKFDLEEYSGKLKGITDRLTIIQLLQKTFSTNGLIAYKIECMVKDLENLTNTYLGELSSGRFQISFKVSSSDKLNVVVTDNGRDIDILALSSGELTRVNTATLLAIRKLMQSLSNARINLLILDETIENLDIEGKEKLIEVLLQEEHLNTILISHGYTHPLLEKVAVIKENNISRIE
jgi:DNA repair exonuclease SbcCD ATPase subunit